MKQCTLICNQANAAWGVAELCVTDKKDVIVVSIVLPHSNDDIATLIMLTNNSTLFTLTSKVYEAMHFNM